MRSSLTTRALAATGAVVSAAAVVVAVVATVWVMPAGVAAVAAGQTPVAGAPGQVIPPTEFVTDITISEDALSVVERSLETLFLDGVRRFDWAQVAESLTEEFGGAFPGAEEGRLVDDPTLSIRRYGSTDRAWLDRSDFVEVLRRQTETWTSVERASWQTFEFLLEPTHDRAFLKGHLQLGGPDPTGARSLMDLTVDARVVAAGPDRWEFERFVVVEGTSVHNPFPPFRDITDAAGFHFNRSDINRDLRQDIVDTRSSLIDSSLSIVDWDDDGFWDVIATESMNRSVLFLNDGKGGFTRGTLPFDDPRLIPAQVLFVDLDGDGVEELVGNRVLYRDGRGSIGIYTRPDGAWLFLPNALEFDNPLDTRRTDAQPMTAGDVNGDGLLDLVIGGYETDQSRDPQRFNRIDAQDGAETLLFINHGDLRFTEESDGRGLSGTRYTYVVHLFDFDSDGDLDLFEGNDYGHNQLWDNQGDGRFRILDEHSLASDASNTMGITIGDWDNSGRWSVHLSNMYSHAGARVVRLTRSLGEQMHDRLVRLTGGNQLFTRESGGWEDRGVALSVNAGGWAWASLFYDLDNDGDKDLFVTNGNTSHRDPNAPDY